MGKGKYIKLHWETYIIYKPSTNPDIGQHNILVRPWGDTYIYHCQWECKVIQHSGAESAST